MPTFSPRSSKQPSPISEGKYPLLVEHFRARICGGKLKQGERLPTFIEMQQQFGVTPNTVNRAMIDLEQKGLVERRRGSGVYVLPTSKPNIRQLSTRKRAGSSVIGLCGYGFERGGNSSYWTRLLEGIRSGAQATNSHVMLLPDSIGDGWEKVDGALISGWSHDHFVEQLPSQIPLVCLFAGHQGRASVITDEYSGMREAVEYLLALGHRRIAYLHGGDAAHLAPRLKAYEDTLCETVIAPHKNWKRGLSGKNDYGPQFIEAGRRDMKSWLEDKTKNGWKQIGCTALLCHNDETAFGAMQAINDAGLSVPGDVSVVGFDGVEIGEYSVPTLTSIEMPLHRIGEIGVELLQLQMQNDEVISNHKILPTSLRMRQSTAAPRALHNSLNISKQ